MTEKLLTFDPFQKATSPDFNKMVQYEKEAMDHLAADGIEPGKGYVGFGVTFTGTKIKVANGRLYDGGPRYFLDTANGYEIDFLNVLPSSQMVLCTLYVVGGEVPTEKANREFLTDVVTRETRAKPTSQETWRVAAVGYKRGDDNASPQKIGVDDRYTVLGWVLLSPTKVEAFEANDATRLRSSREAWAKAQQNAARLDALDPKLISLDRDVSAAVAATRGKLDAEFGYRMAQRVAVLSAKADLPDTYIDAGADVFHTEADSDTAAVGYVAKVKEGLRFPPINTATSVLGLLNENEAKVYKDPSGLILPAWQDTRTRVIAGNAGSLALNSIAYTTTSILNRTLAPSRIRLGEEFVVSTNSDWWKDAKITDGAIISIQKNGESFQAYPTSIIGPNNVQQYRVRKIWTDTPASPYWDRQTAGPSVLEGYKYAQTWLNQRATWMTAIGLGFNKLDTAGGRLTAMVCECFADGSPNDKAVLASTSALPGELRAGQFVRLPITPIMLAPGKQYAVVLNSAANHTIAVADTTQAASGSGFFKSGNGVWTNDPGLFILLDVWYAEFPAIRTEVQLKSLYLLGGIASLDIIAQKIVPETAGFFFSVEIGGKKIPLTEDNVANFPFASLPDTLPLYMTFTGGGTVQPGIVLPTSQVVVSRPNTVLKHFSKPKVLGTATTKIRTITRLENFKTAKHTHTPKLLVAGSEVSATLVKDLQIDATTVERTAFFDLGAATTTFERISSLTTTDVTDLCLASQISHIAVPA